MTDPDLVRSLRQHVDRMAGLIGPRHLGKPQTIRSTTKFLEHELAVRGAKVTHESYIASGQEVSNLIVEWRGIERPDEILIIGAHYDTVPSTPGADDNASAVAVLLEIIGRLTGEKFDRTVRFVFFPCEEPPHFHLGEMGSQIHSCRCRTQEENVIGMLCLEMLGFFTDAPDSQKLPPGIPKCLHWLFPRKGNFLAAVANPASTLLLMRFRQGFKRASTFPLFTIPLPEKIREIRLSDHSNFWDQGFPALMLTDTSFLRNPHYHQPSDLPETLDYERMADLTIGICGAIRALATT